MNIKINGNPTDMRTELTSGRIFGVDVRATLPAEAASYSMWREGSPDKQISDATEIFEGDSVYLIPEGKWGG